jgi:hypothetical protein
MGKMKISITKFLLLILCFSIFLGSSESLAAKTKTQSKSASGQLIYISIPTPSIGNSILGNATSQPAVVYLPPSYTEGKKNYPVVYYLSGWGDDFKSLTNAKTDDEITPDNDYMMRGHHISVKTLDLNTDFNNIKKQPDGHSLIK